MNTHTYHTDDLVLNVPAGFRDHTMQALEWHTPKGERIALALQRERLSQGDTLETVYQKALAGYPKQLLAFRLDNEETTQIHGVAVRIARFRWKHKVHTMYHHQAFLMLSGTVFVFTASGPAIAAPDVDALMAEALSGLRVREG
jgi:hypothetical protein